MRGICIQAPEKSNLIEGEKYYLFPHGNHAVEVSNFPHHGSHFGTYQKSRFQIIDETVTETVELPTVAETPLQRYLARVVMPPSKFYIVGEEYIISETNANGYYDVFFKSKPDCAPVGSYKNRDCFELIENYNQVTSTAKNDIANEPLMVPVASESKIKNELTKKHEYTQLSLF